MEQRPASVPQAKQAGESQSLWGWVEPTVWTERMLSALDNGVKGGVWFSLIDKVYSPGNLQSALAKVAANKGAAGVDHVSVEQYLQEAETNLKILEEQLRTGTYRPQAIRRVYLPKPGTTEKRPLGIPTVRDRVVQTAIVNVIAPIFEKTFARCSFGFRPNLGAQSALDAVEEYLKAGLVHVVDVDLRRYFDRILQDLLMQRVKEKVADGRLLALIESFLKAGILEGGKETTPETGTPQGAVLSPLLSNIYLNQLDHTMEEQGMAMVRYADDFIILCRTRQEAETALQKVAEWASENGQELHAEKTRIVDARTEAFDFLGYRFHGKLRLVRPKSLGKLKESVRAKTKRTNGQSLQVIIGNLNQTLSGWYRYFRRCTHTVFSGLDGWIRRRLRSILRKRLGLKGISRHGADEVERWPNKYFEGQGLFSLKAAHASSGIPP